EAPPPAPDESAALAPEPEPPPPEAVTEVEIVPAEEPAPVAPAGAHELEPRDEVAGSPPPDPPPPSAPLPRRPPRLAGWLAGSVVWLALTGLRLRRFARLLRYARPAPDWLRREADSIARRLGLEEAPPVWLLPGQVSPMLWAPVRAVSLLLPARLMDRLN